MLENGAIGYIFSLKEIIYISAAMGYDKLVGFEYSEDSDKITKNWLDVKKSLITKTYIKEDENSIIIDKKIKALFDVITSPLIHFQISSQKEALRYYYSYKISVIVQTYNSAKEKYVIYPRALVTDAKKSFIDVFDNSVFYAGGSCFEKTDISFDDYSAISDCVEYEDYSKITNTTLRDILKTVNNAVDFQLAFCFDNIQCDNENLKFLVNDTDLYCLHTHTNNNITNSMLIKADDVFFKEMICSYFDFISPDEEDNEIEY